MYFLFPKETDIILEEIVDHFSKLGINCDPHDRKTFFKEVREVNSEIKKCLNSGVIELLKSGGSNRKYSNALHNIFVDIFLAIFDSMPEISSPEETEYYFFKKNC